MKMETAMNHAPMQHRKSCRFVLAAVAALLLGPMPTWAQERPLKKINWGQTALSAAMWIPWIAKDAKLYEKNGLDVEIVLLRDQVRPVRLAERDVTTLARAVKDLIALAKAKPGTLKQSGGSVTSRDNIVRLSLQHATGAKWAFVSFPGGGERAAARAVEAERREHPLAVGRRVRPVRHRPVSRPRRGRRMPRRRAGRRVAPDRRR